MTKPTWLRGNVLVLGIVSLLTDAASEMVFPLLPLFVTSVLGGGALALGAIEGVADGVASVLKLVAGRVSDRSGRRRGFVIFGYGLASVVRPLVALATAPWHVLAVRFADRIGKGLRGSPRDALLAASVPPEARGRAFGFHRAMDHAGAAIGPLLAVGLLVAGYELRTIFLLSIVPGALVMMVAVFGVRDLEAPPGAAKVPKGRPSPALRRLLLPFGLFALGSPSEAFLLLLAGEHQTPVYGLPLLWMALHVVKSAFALVGGGITDRIGARRVLTLGWLAAAAVWAGFALVGSTLGLMALFLLHGVRAGFIDGAEKALVAAAVPAEERGSAFGWAQLVTGILALPASLLAGALWQRIGHATAFGVCAALAVAAALALVAVRPRNRE